MSLGVLYLFATEPTYVATASMVIDTRKAQLLDPQSASRGEINVDVGMVQTEIELLKSDNVSRAVVNQLNLIDDPEFAGGPSRIYWLSDRPSLQYTRPTRTAAGEGSRTWRARNWRNGCSRHSRASGR